MATGRELKVFHFPTLGMEQAQLQVHLPPVADNKPIVNSNSYVSNNVLANSSIEETINNENINVKQEAVEEEPEVDIVINNVVCTFNVRCHLNLRQIATNGANVEYKRENGKLTWKLRNPYSTSNIWSSGKITCTGSTSEDAAKKAARKCTRMLQKLGFRVRFTNFKVVNVLGTCSMPFAIKLVCFSESNRASTSYEPELHPGATYRMKDIKATLKIFSTGSITVTAPSVANVQQAIERIFPLVYEHRSERKVTKQKWKTPKVEPLKEEFIDDEDYDDFSDEDEEDEEWE